ncbi:hypothetical protein [Pricia sp.]|uniref:DUF7402 domain-containing protein n=1 Tax=Pricia sp. TaxID=2268138 RepID=UPI0035940B72
MIRKTGGINYPWLKMIWDSAQTINKVILYDRPNLNTHAAVGTLYFSDGSQISVTALPNVGAAITF